MPKLGGTKSRFVYVMQCPITYCFCLVEFQEFWSMMRVLASLVKTLEKAMEEVKSYQWECCFEVYVFRKQC